VVIMEEVRVVIIVERKDCLLGLEVGTWWV
jgi:hypothetical protein